MNAPLRSASSSLFELIATVCGSRRLAEQLIEGARAESGLAAVPRGGRALLSFARAHLVERLSLEIGPRLALAMLDELREGLAHEEDPESSGVHRHVQTALVLGGDAFRRARLGRVLVQAGLSVEGRASVAEAFDVLHFDVAIIQVQQTFDLFDLMRLHERNRRAAMLVLSDEHAHDAERALAGARCTRSRVVPTATMERRVVALARELLAEKK